jgi:hypothetical protein
MKNLVLLFAIVLVVFTGKNVLASETNAEFKAYSITEVDDLFLGKDIKAVWKISYSESETPVTVVKKKTVEGTEYVVHSKYFEVCYLASNKGFGTKEVRKSCRNVPTKINSAVIDQEQMKRQRIITPNQVDDEKALGLIASYLPELINTGYTHVLN